MKRVLVTGATGGLGRNAVEALLAQGVAVRATGRNSIIGAQLNARGANFIAADLVTASAGQLAQLLQGVDVVWHCAALSSPWGRLQDFEAANVEATRRLLAAAAVAEVKRFIHISTPALYFDYTNRFNVPESYRPRRYANHYAATKAQAEQCVREAAERHPDMLAVTLRPRAIFGAYDQVLIPRLLRVLKSRNGRLPLPNGGTATLDLTYVENVVHAMWLASVHHDERTLPSGSVLNITNHEPIQLGTALEKLFRDGLRQSFEIVALPRWLMANAAHCMQAFSQITGKEPMLTPYSVGTLGYHMTLDNQRAIDSLGYRPPISLEEGIVRTVKWLKQHG
jgi:nucleoside-diphosphate-sugar epimerase